MYRWFTRTPLLAAAALLAFCGSALAQVNVVNATTTNTTSTTHHETDIRVDLPPAGGVVAAGPLGNLLQQILVGPNGATVSNALQSIGALGAGAVTAPVQVGHVSLGVNTTVTNSITIGPGTAIVGTEQGTTFFVAAGNQNINTNTHTESFFDNLFQGTVGALLTAAAVNWLSGDIYTTVSTTIFDGNFRFVDSLFSRAHSGGGPSASSTSPMQYAELSFDDNGTVLGGPGDASMEALAYAARKSDRSALPAVLKAPPPPPPNVGVWTLWLKGEYSTANFAGNATQFGFGYRSGGGALGVDYRKNDWLLGIAVAYDKARIDEDITGDNGRIGTTRIGGFASYQPGPWSLTAALAGNFHSISADRLGLLGLPASSRYDGQSLSAGFEAAHKYVWWGGTIQPLAGIVYTDLHADAFRENGGALLALAGNSANVESLKGYVGARASNTYPLAGGWLLTPELRARLLYEFLDTQGIFAGQFIADPAATAFAISGVRTDRLGEILGTSIGLWLNPQWKAFVSYDAEIRGRDVANVVAGGVKAHW